LYYIIEVSNFRSFASRTRINGKPVKISHGNVPLSVARKLHADVLQEVKQGNDPRHAKVRARVTRKAIEADTFAAIVEKYFQIECGLKRDNGGVTFNNVHRTAKRRLADLERLVLPRIGSRPITLIKRSEVVAVLDKIQQENGAVMADRTLGVMRRIFNWHATRSDDFRSPVVRGMARAKTNPRQRILTDDEIRKVWVDAPGPFAAIIKLALLTGARRSELSGMTWDEIGNDGIWELPPSRNKTGQPLSRPLSAAALAVIETQRNDSPFVFTANGKTAFSEFTRSKQKFDQQTGTKNWTIHDCRRSARSLMSRAGVDQHIAERALGHAVGGQIQRTYDQHHYQPELRLCFDKLAALLDRIINPPPANVTPLRKKKQR
jgi:integrase